MAVLWQNFGGVKVSLDVPAYTVDLVNIAPGPPPGPIAPGPAIPAAAPNPAPPTMAPNPDVPVEQTAAAPEPPKPEPAKPEPVKAPPRPDPEPDTGDEAEERLFARAMSGVRPMDGAVRGREVAPGPVPEPLAPQADADAEGRNALLDLVAGTVEFELSLSDEYVQGFVKDIDQKVFRQLRAGQFSPEAHLDLHGQNADQAQFGLLRFVRARHLHE